MTETQREHAFRHWDVRRFKWLHTPVSPIPPVSLGLVYLAIAASLRGPQDSPHARYWARLRGLRLPPMDDPKSQENPRT